MRILAGVLLCAAVLAAWIVTTPRAETPPPEDTGRLEIATFAGGCFWCMEPAFDRLDGVITTVVGYTGGREKNPSYKQVSAGATGHAEAIQIRYEPAKITYEELVDVFWHNIDPTAADRQFCDGGTQYRSGIFYHNDAQKQVAEETKRTIVDSKRFSRVVTEITAFEAFYRAEEYHQDFYQKNPDHYKAYRKGCGRDRRLEELWGETPAH